MGLGGGFGRELTIFFPMFAFDPPEDVRKALVFGSFHTAHKMKFSIRDFFSK